MEFIQNISKDIIKKDLVQGWVLINFIIAAIPIFIALITGIPDTYIAVLSYCYAFLVVGFYLFFIHVTLHGNPKDGHTIFGSSLLGIAVVVILLFSYSSGTISNFIQSHPVITLVVSFVTVIPAFFLAFRLNVPIINLHEAQLREKQNAELKETDQKFKTAEGTGKGVQDSKSEIEIAAEEE